MHLTKYLLKKINKHISQPDIKSLVSQNLVSSKAEAKRLIAQNAVKIDGEVCSDPAHVLKKDSDELVIKVGKRRFLRVLGW